jgi:hypothetical protein
MRLSVATHVVLIAIAIDFVAGLLRQQTTHTCPHASKLFPNFVLPLAIEINCNCNRDRQQNDHQSANPNELAHVEHLLNACALGCVDRESELHLLFSVIKSDVEVAHKCVSEDKW